MTSKSFNNIRYAFLFWSHSDNCWRRTHRLFHLVDMGNTLYGQYITDMEFNVAVCDKPLHFAVVGVSDKNTFNNLEKEMNQSDNPSIKDLEEINLNIKFKEYFLLRKDLWEQYKKKLIKKQSDKYTFFGKFNSGNTLSLRFDCHKNYGIMCCLPEFNIAKN
jgi:hypothetical protein